MTASLQQGPVAFAHFRPLGVRGRSSCAAATDPWFSVGPAGRAGRKFDADRCRLAIEGLIPAVWASIRSRSAGTLSAGARGGAGLLALPAVQAGPGPPAGLWALIRLVSLAEYACRCPGPPQGPAARPRKPTGRAARGQGCRRAAPSFCRGLRGARSRGGGGGPPGGGSNGAVRCGGSPTRSSAMFRSKVARRRSRVLAHSAARLQTRRCHRASVELLGAASPPSSTRLRQGDSGRSGATCTALLAGHLPAHLYPARAGQVPCQVPRRTTHAGQRSSVLPESLAGSRGRRIAAARLRHVVACRARRGACRPPGRRS